MRTSILCFLFLLFRFGSAFTFAGPICSTHMTSFNTPPMLGEETFFSTPSSSLSRSRPSSLFLPLYFNADTSLSAESPSGPSLIGTTRSRLRRATGFSLTAMRATLRAITGMSLTTVYASTFAVTGAWIRQSMKLFLSIFPTWVRSFAQPFLILYYAPLFIVRNFTGPNRKRARQTHEYFMEGWKDAVIQADQKTSYWPVHISDDGKSFESDINEIDMKEAVAESVEVSMEQQQQQQGGVK